jgi:[ribosomal protein S5]-alanine N-acetyltransferase
MRPRHSFADVAVMSSMLKFPVDGVVSERLTIRPIAIGDAAAILGYHVRNRAHLQPWEPLRTDDFYTLPSTQARIAGTVAQMHDGLAVHLVFIDRETGVLIGTCNFSNLIRGAFQACHLGFSISASAEGRGYMREGVRRSIGEMFARYDLHRVMANHRPENLRSARLLQSLGFEREGLARSYLKINGEWTDHVMTALINPAH